MKDLQEAGKALKETDKTLKETGKALTREAAKNLQVHEAEREIRHEKIAAEIKHLENMRQVKKEVEEETKELKALLS